MRIAVAGGTGMVGSRTVETLRAAGHEPVVLSLSTGVDLVSGDGLAEALEGVEAVVDTTNSDTLDYDELTAFFRAATGNLLEYGQRAGVGHHVLLSIFDVAPDTPNPHQQAKLRQEEVVREGGVPYTIVHAPQFFELADLMASWTRDGDRAVVPPLRVRAAAAIDVGDALAQVATEPPRDGVGDALAQVATEPPRDGVRDVTGPEEVILSDVAQRAAAARGEALQVEASWENSPVDEKDPPAEPAPDAIVTRTTLDQWLAAL